ncbi:MAG: MBOAT family O-acyltransferase [Minicystis sp.]
MLFNSLQFALFFPFTTALFFLAPPRLRWLVLLVMSCVFYMAFVPAYILILVVTIVVDYFAGLWIGRTEGPARKVALILSIIVNVGFLAFFKYWAFLAVNATELVHSLGGTWSVPTLSIVLPIGLSFHIFQSLSYTIEVYRRAQKPERHFGIYALYVMFYPQLVAGPIERPQNLLHQFHEPKPFDPLRAASGLQRMLWGFFKKVAVADRLAPMVDVVYRDPHAHTGLPLLAATLAFSIEIYCDFSGYSDIALGTAELMGFELMENFDRPYFSGSIGEFWTRWHRSLSTWFRDYLYIPLGGSRAGELRWARNIVIVFAVSGLWHGANWTFVVWGLLHASFQLAGRLKNKLWKRPAEKQKTAIDLLRTFSLVTFAWIFFRARSLSDAGYIAAHLFQGLTAQLASPRAAWVALRPLAHVQEMATALVLVAILLGIEALQARGGPLRPRLFQAPRWLRWGLCYACLFTTILLGVYGHTAFIYFQF